MVLKSEREVKALAVKAVAAGMEAVKVLHVQAMVVYEADLLSGKAKAGGKLWYVADGVCGFAWINLRGVLGRERAWWAKIGFSGRALDGGSGIGFWVGDFNQSLQKKEAFARAYAEVLQEAGYKAYSGSRMD